MPVNALFEACRQIGTSLGVNLRESARLHDRLEAIIDGSGLLYRQVILRDAWWLTDSGTLLAYVKEGGAPVALLPSPGGTYHFQDSVTGKNLRVTQDFAQGLRPLAWNLSKGLPSGVLGLRELMRECAKAISVSDFVWILAMGLACGLLGLGIPITTAWVLSETIPLGLADQFGALGILMVSITLAGVLFQELRTRSGLRITMAVSRRLEPALWDRLIRLPAGFFRIYSSGELLHRTESLSRIRQLASELAVHSLLTGIFSLLNLAVLFIWSVPLASVALLLAGTATSLALRLVWLRLGPARKIQELDARILGNLAQIIQGIAKIRLSNTGIGAFGLWSGDFLSKQEQHRKSAGLALLGAAFQAAWPALCLSVLFGLFTSVGGWGLSFGTFLGFLAAFQLLLSSLQRLTDTAADLVEAVPLFEHGRPLLQTKPEIPPDCLDPGELTGSIEVRNLRFSYPGNSLAVIDGLNLRVEPGEYLAVTGTSGSGKSTLLRLLLGFEEAQEGAVFYNGLDLRSLDRAALRRQVGVVLQDCRIMAGTVFANIAGAVVGCSPDDVLAAATLAGLEADIQSMPMGLYTVLAEGGTTISGGQRQRILIARALVSRPRVLLFDEATSALDNRTQDMVIRSLRDVKATRIVIAHRLSTVAEADRVAVLEAGRVVELGPYRDLLAAGGHFTELVRRQIL